MKKNHIYLLIAGCLVLLCLVVVLFKTGTLHGPNRAPKSNAFAVKDTSTVSKVFIADMNGESVLLTRKEDGWYVQDTVKAMPTKIDELLSVVANITMQQTVAKTAQSNINKMMSVNAIKVEIYQKAPKFTLFKHPFFVKERLVKTYYMGPATMDNVSNFAILEGFDEPCTVHIPGFRGFLTPTFSFHATDWFNCDLFSTKITRIKTLKVVDVENPAQSFTVEKSGARFFSLFDAQHQQIMDYDTVRLLDMLSEYRDKNYETYVTTVGDSERDSILRFNLFKTITLVDVDGKETRLDLYRKLTPDAMYLDAILGGTEEMTEDGPYNRDKFYAVLNGKADHLVQCQYYHFDRQIQPLSYFLKKQ